MALPAACVLRISEVTEGARTQIMPMIHPLVGQAEYGTDSVQKVKNVRQP